MVGFARDARAKVGQQVKGRVPHILDRRVAAQGRVQLVPFQDIAEVADPRRRKRLDRPGADRVHADAVLAQILGQIPHRRLERGLGHPHDVVVRHHPLGPVIGQRHQAAAVGHHRRRPPRDRGERIDRDVHRHQEVVAAGVGIAAAQFLLVGKADRVDDEVERAPFLFQRREQVVHRLHVAHVARNDQRRAELLGQRHDALLERIALIREGELRTRARQRPGDAPRDRLVVGQPHDEPALARHQPGRGLVHLRPGGIA